DAIKVAFFASDGFSTDLPIATAQQSNIVLAYAENGNPLPDELRLVVPGEWGYKWIDLVTNIQLVNFNYLGTEESLGYDDNGVALYSIPPQLPSSSNTSTSPNPTIAPSPTPHFSTTPSPTFATPTQTSKQTFPTTNYIFITVIAILIATATAAVILRKTKHAKNKNQVQTAPPS